MFSAWNHERVHKSVLGCAALSAVLLVSCGKSEDEEERRRQQEEQAEMSQIEKNLDLLGKALHSFHDSHGVLPAPDYAPELSNGPALNPPRMHWRVAILPFIEQGPVWDGIVMGRYAAGKNGLEFWKNAELVKARPPLYGGHGDIKDDTLTRFRGFVGNGAAWETGKNLRLVDFTDGIANTILLVEAEEAVPWTQAAELPYDPAKPLPRLGAPGRDYFFALMANGTVKKIKKNINEETLRALITRSGNEAISLD